MWTSWRDSCGVIRPTIFWTALIAFWILCLGASTVEAQVPVGMGMGLSVPTILNIATVGGGVLAVIVRIDTTQKQRDKADEKRDEMYLRGMAEIKADIKDMRAAMYTRLEAEAHWQTATSEHTAFDKRITRLEEHEDA